MQVTKMELSSHLPNLCLCLVYILLIQLETIKWREKESIMSLCVKKLAQKV